jgi:hypothetical protein
MRAHVDRIGPPSREEEDRLKARFVLQVWGQGWGFALLTDADE